LRIMNWRSLHGIIYLIFFCGFYPLLVQEPDPPNWDNQLFIGNKIATGHGQWRYSGEIQVRLKDDLQALDQ